MRRAGDILVLRALAQAHRATSSEAAGSTIDLGAARSKRPLAAILDVGAVAGTGSFDVGVEGSDDGSTWVTAIKHNAAGDADFPQVTDTDDPVRHLLHLKPYRYYRASASTIVTLTSVDYTIQLVGFASEAAPTFA